MSILRSNKGSFKSDEENKEENIPLRKLTSDMNFSSKLLTIFYFYN